MKTPLPLRLLAFFGNACPGVWRRFDELREKTKPDSRVFADLVEVLRASPFLTGIPEKALDGDMLSENDGRLMIMLSSLGAWRPAQDIVRFGDEVYDALSESDLGDSIPVGILSHMPAWSIFFETPHGFADPDYGPWDGFFATLDGKADRLVLLFVKDDLDDGPTCRAAVLNFPGNLAVAPIDKSTESFDDSVRKAISFLLYACVNGLSDSPGALTRPVPKPSPKKTKKGWRLFPAIKPAIRLLGAECERRLASFREEHAHIARNGHVRPHIRRAHWHGYWTGPKSGNRNLDVRWLPPIIVAARDDENLQNMSIFS